MSATKLIGIAIAIGYAIGIVIIVVMERRNDKRLERINQRRYIEQTRKDIISNGSYADKRNKYN